MTTPPPGPPPPPSKTPGRGWASSACPRRERRRAPRRAVSSSCGLSVRAHRHRPESSVTERDRHVAAARQALGPRRRTADLAEVRGSSRGRELGCRRVFSNSVSRPRASSSCGPKRPRRSARANLTVAAPGTTTCCSLPPPAASEGNTISADNEHLARVMDPWSWLPATAWEDREIRAYVPSTVPGHDLATAEVPRSEYRSGTSSPLSYRQRRWISSTPRSGNDRAAVLRNVHDRRGPRPCRRPRRCRARTGRAVERRISWTTNSSHGDPPAMAGDPRCRTWWRTSVCDPSLLFVVVLVARPAVLCIPCFDASLTARPRRSASQLRRRHTSTARHSAPPVGK